MPESQTKMVGYPAWYWIS